MIGKIQRKGLRDVWPHEAHNFTTWLEENIDVLSDALDLQLSNPEREQTAGSFSVDLVCEDESGGRVIVENQLERSDHDHLGKLLTYLASFEAKAAIWIVADPRPEHVKAISWLNEASVADFYLVKVEAISIGGSEPAPLLTLITGPSDEARAVGDTKKEMAEGHVVRRFWAGLLALAKTKSRLHSGISPGRKLWVGTGSGVRGLSFNYVISRDEGRVELYLDRGPGSGDENKEFFAHLLEKKGEVEKAFGGELDWQSLEGRRACRISHVAAQKGYRDPEQDWPEVQERLVDAMCRLEKALKPHLARLKGLPGTCQHRASPVVPSDGGQP